MLLRLNLALINKFSELSCADKKERSNLEAITVDEPILGKQ